MDSDGCQNPETANSAGETEFRCPTCRALLYSRKSRVCGQCGAVLPHEMILTDEQASERCEDRRWAKELADKFGTAGRPTAHDSDKPDVSSLEETLRRMSCAVEFAHRKRYTWFYVTGCTVTLLILWILYLVFGQLLHGNANGRLILPWLILSAMDVFSWFVLWWRAAPICPNCKQNIRMCPTHYCHVCGKSLNHKRCTDCGVDNSWTGWFRPYNNGAFQWITYCPGCGVELDTWITRWRAGNS